MQLNFLSGKKSNLSNKAVTNGTVYFTDEGQIYFDKNNVRTLMSAHADTSQLSLSQNGKLLYSDPTFKSGVNSVGKYGNTSGSTDLTISRITDSEYCPTGSGNILQIKVSGTATSPGCGGFVQTLTSYANAEFIVQYLIKLPVGYKLNVASNGMGSGYTDTFITSTAGTGKWEWYVRKVKCGSSGSFSNGGHVYVSRTTGNAPSSSSPLTWYLGGIWSYNMAKSEDRFYGTADTANNALKLGGQTPSYYATSEALTALQGTVNGKLNLSGGTMTGPIRHTSASLPQSSSLQYIVGIDAFADGGTMKWQAASSVLVGKATADALGNNINDYYASKSLVADIQSSLANVGTDVGNLKASSTYFVEGTQTAATGSWTGTLAAVTAPYDGLTIRYYLPYAGSGNASLALNGGTAYPIYRYGTSTRITTHFSAGSVITMTFRTNYNVSGSTKTNAWLVDAFYYSDNYVGVICSTGASTAAKTGSTSYYTLADNKYFMIRIATSNTYAGALTLNINSNGAKPIYINGAASSATNYTLNRGLYLVYYDGSNYHFRTDGKIPGTAVNAEFATKDAAGNTITSYYAKAADLTSLQGTVNGKVSKSGDTVTGQLLIDSGGVDTKGLVISRGAGLSEAARHYVDDRTYYITYTNDEYANNIRFTLKNTDTENSDGSRANTSTVIFKGSSSGSEVQATNFTGLASKATADASGNIITSYYAKQSDLTALTTTVNGKLDKTGGTVTGDLTLNQNLNVKGILQNGRVFYNVLNFYKNNTVDEIVIKTKIPFTSGSIMPVIQLKGYAYGNDTPTELTVAFYIYQGAFNSYKATFTGTWKPELKLSTYTNNGTKYVALSIIGSVYYPRFSVDFIDIWSSTTRDYASGWAVEMKLATDTTSIVPTTDAITVSYAALANDITGNAATATKLLNTRNIFGQAFNGTADIAGQATVYGTYQSDASIRYSNSALEIREAGLVTNTQEDIGYAPTIGFHWSNRVGATLALHKDAVFYFRRQNGTDRATIDANLRGNAATATSATKATQDASGNVITSTYATKSALASLDTAVQGKVNRSGDTMTGSLGVKGTITIGDGVTLEFDSTTKCLNFNFI